MEADSLNCIVLGEDVKPGMPEWEIFVREVRKEMTVKAGQKCTAIRRIFVPENKMEEMRKSISRELAQTLIGNPVNEKVKMGSLAGQDQRKEVKTQVQKLLASSKIIYGSLDSVELVDADILKGAFMGPILLENENPYTGGAHDIEAFGPVSTLMSYKDMEEAIQLSKKGKGSLCSTIVTASDQNCKRICGKRSYSSWQNIGPESSGCQRKYRTWVSAAYACSWWSRSCRGWRRNGWNARGKTLYAKSSNPGFTR